MLKSTVKELEEHCKARHEGQNLGFLVWGKEAKRPMFTNFGEWLANKGIDLITVPGYLYKKVEGVSIDPETGGLYRDDLQMSNTRCRQNQAYVRHFLGY